MEEVYITCYIYTSEIMSPSCLFVRWDVFEQMQSEPLPLRFVQKRMSRPVDLNSSHVREGPNSSRPVAKKRQMGFDCEFVDHPPEMLQVECPVCLLVLCEPHQVTCCGYEFCRVCIERIRTDKQPCPTCKQTDFSVFPDIRLQCSLYEFCVWCSHKTDGCEWSGKLGQLEKHLNESPKLGQQFIGCEFVKVECHHCCKLFQRCYVKVHQIEECIRRPFSCDYCGNYGSDFEDVTLKHWPVCAFYPVPCPSKCGACPERQNLDNHMSKDCPLTVVNCDFCYAGCEVQLPHKDLPAHLAENLVAHTSLMATYNRSKVQEMDQQIAQLTEELRGNKQSIIRLEKENKVLKQTLLDKMNTIAQLQKDMLKREVALNEELTQLKARQEELQPFTDFPIEFIMTEFEKHKQAGDHWYSEPFYTHLHGYKACLRVDANGWDDGKGTHISVWAHLMWGEFDDLLKWPFRGDITVQMINQLQDKEHHTEIMDFSQADEASDALSIGRVTTGEVAKDGYGEDKFFPHSELGHDQAKNRQFLKDDCLHFRITQVTNVDTGQKTKRRVAS